MKHVKKNYILDAVLLILAGVVLFLRPDTALDFFCTAFGIILLIMGAVKILTYFLEKDPELKNGGSLFVAAAQIIFGIALLANPKFFIGLFPFVAGVIIGCGALMSLVETVRLRKYDLPGGSMSVVMSLITLALALIVIVHPAAITAFIVQLVGISLAVEGVTMIISMSRRTAEYR